MWHLLILRPSCNFRDGAVIRNVIVNFRSYLSQLPFNDCYLLGLIHVLPTCPSKYHSFYKCLSFEAREINTRDIMLGFTSLFLFIKSYANCLIAEINQLCYKGVLRTVTLGSTNGLCTWRCSSIMAFQPVIVPVGRIALGRILNVVGSILDRYLDLSNIDRVLFQFYTLYLDLSLSSQFNTNSIVDSGSCVESYPELTFTLSYPDTDICLTFLSPFLGVVNLTQMNNILESDWIFICCIFLISGHWTNLSVL